MLLEPGTLIRHYRIDALLGRGGMGEVYHGVHTRIGRSVAIKLLPRVDGHSAERFLNEARIQAGLHHPNIAELYDFFEFDQRPCIVMEYLGGPNLRELLDQQGPLPGRQALGHFLSLARAVEHLHRNGIVHRDIKTANVKLGAAGEPKLLDFGIAKDADSPRLTTADYIIGTVRYLAPEQLKGRPASPASDVWALGIVFYEMLTGKAPFDGSSLTECGEKILRGDYPAIDAVIGEPGSRYRPLIARCLRVDPERRYRSATELCQDAEVLLHISGEPARERSIFPAADRELQNWRLRDFWPAILSFMLIAAILGWYGFRSLA